MKRASTLDRRQQQIEPPRSLKAHEISDKALHKDGRGQRGKRG